MEIDPHCGHHSQLSDEFLNRIRTTIDEQELEVLLDDSNNQEPGSNSVEELPTVNKEERPGHTDDKQ